MTEHFDFNNPLPVAQVITHVSDGQLLHLQIARNAADMRPQGTKPGDALDDATAW